MALKEIQDRHADNPGARNQFAREAKITARLEHPGIVPVYGLGTYADGRPFYAMRLVHGDSLQHAIREFHKSDSPGKSREDDILQLRGFLIRFLQVCHAIHYAHDHGIVHRDIKPSNIMIGKYGEAVVLDWGLAKHQKGEDTIHPAGAASRVPDEDAADRIWDTGVGGLVGTPAFMSPEQAMGQMELIGTASDIFNLGATLYCLVTGRSPFEHEKDIMLVVQKAQRADFPKPSKVKKGIPRALEEICLKAMSLRPEDRYASAGALADDLERWLSGQSVSVYREPWYRRVLRLR